MIVNIVLGIRYFFTQRALVPILLRVIQLVNMIVNALLGIRYFFTHRALVPILLRVIQLVNKIVNALLGIRYFFHPSFPRPHSSESHTVCQRSIRYYVFFHPWCPHPLIMRLILLANMFLIVVSGIRFLIFTLCTFIFILVRVI